MNRTEKRLFELLQSVLSYVDSHPEADLPLTLLEDIRTELSEFSEQLDHTLVDGRYACSCGNWEPQLGESISRAFDKHLLEVRKENQ